MGHVQDEKQVFLRVGAGSFATVYVIESHAYYAIKQVADPARSIELEKEHRDLVALYDKAGTGGLLFKVPKPIAYYSSYAKFAQVRCSSAMSVEARF